MHLTESSLESNESRLIFGGFSVGSKFGTEQREFQIGIQNSYRLTVHLMPKL